MSGAGNVRTNPARVLVERFQSTIDGTGCGAILIVSTTTNGEADVECSTNLSRDSQIKVLRLLLAKIEART